MGDAVVRNLKDGWLLVLCAGHGEPDRLVLVRDEPTRIVFEIDAPGICSINSTERTQRSRELVRDALIDVSDALASQTSPEAVGPARTAPRK